MNDISVVAIAVAQLRRPYTQLQVRVDIVLALKVWDLGGQANLRPSWQTYYKATDAVIMIVDSTDRARVGIAKVNSMLWHRYWMLPLSANMYSTGYLALFPPEVLQARSNHICLHSCCSTFAYCFRLALILPCCCVAERVV